MTSPRDPSPGSFEDHASDALDADAGRVFDAYLAGLEAGEPADPERLLAAHPHLADRLAACLAVMPMAGAMDASASGGSISGLSRATAHLDATVSSPPARSALTTLGLGPDAIPRVHLRDVSGEREPLVKPRSDTMPLAAQTGFARYQLQGEIARGGMGAIFKGRDVDLGRELAIKVLLEAHQGNAEVVRRFVEEAQIGGQLQHPGIAPVFELGTFPEPDRRPYFAMKLVKGQTLSALLSERGRVSAPSPDGDTPGANATGLAADLPRFLSIFEAVCQTMAYAHARGVIHRDLKPSNIMVGSFGEVQVMDWGLAKVLPQGGIADEDRAEHANETVIMTVRSGSSGSSGESQAGSVLGTPSYMAPEQARGEVEQIDERSDVFGLGAILCEILTGQPPFVASSREETRSQAARGDLAEALGRLGICGADTELIEVARSCLRPERNRRPRNAGQVARRISGYLAGVQERLKAAELARVEAQVRSEEETKRRAVAEELAREARARADEERKRRRTMAALAVSVLVTAGSASGGWNYLERQRRERTARFSRAVSDLEFRYAEAIRVGDDHARWLEARGAVRAVQGLSGDVPDEPTGRRVQALLRQVDQEAEAAANDQKFLADLADIRSAGADDVLLCDAAYAEAFRRAGIDVASLTPDQAGKRIQARPTKVRAALAAALDDWAAVRRGISDRKSGAARLTEVARLVDPDPWRDRLRTLIAEPRARERLTRLQELARSASTQRLPPASLELLGRALLAEGGLAAAEGMLREAQQRHPGDCQLNDALADCLQRLGMRAESIRYYMAARSLRPEQSHQMAHALEEIGETDQAIAVLLDLSTRRPTQGAHLACLASVMIDHGRTLEARPVLDDAVAALRTAIGLNIRNATAHLYLGRALHAQGKLDEAVAELRQAFRIEPNSSFARVSLGDVLHDLGKSEEALAEYREAIRLKPDAFEAHNQLGIALREKGTLEEAVAECREAIRLKPGLAAPHGNLGNALKDQGKLEEAVAEYREAMRRRPDSAQLHHNLGGVLQDQGKLEEAVAQYHEALRLKPDLAATHTQLGVALRDQGKLQEAVAECREAIRLKPNSAEGHHSLGGALQVEGKLDEAVAEWREAIHLKPDLAEAHSNLGLALTAQGKLEEAVAECREAIRLKPDFAGAHLNLGLALRSRSELAAALSELRTARDLAGNRPNLAAMIERELRATERQASLAARLPEVLAGRYTPYGPAETLGFAWLCYQKKLHGRSAGFWAETFQAVPKLADDMQTQHRYNAACAAALAGYGEGKDNPALDGSAKARWRQQALDWLRADLAHWTKEAESKKPEAKALVAKTLQHWKTDPDLAGLRDPEVLKRLSEPEQTACRAVWADVDAVLAKARSGTK
jgi:serine/threonine-protein kinase